MALDRLMELSVSSETLAQATRVIDLLGVFANAILGGVVARGHRFDAVGFVVLAIASGLGGGLIRDALLQQGTAAALADSSYVIVALVGALTAFVLRVEGRAWDRLYPVIDALALGCWAAVGANRALVMELGWLPVVLLGTLTAVGGGVVRDVLVQRVPTIFGGNTLYATCAAASSMVMIAMFETGHPVSGLMVTTLVGAGLTLLARHRQWMLPESYAWRPPMRAVPRPRLPRRR